MRNNRADLLANLGVDEARGQEGENPE